MKKVILSFVVIASFVFTSCEKDLGLNNEMSEDDFLDLMATDAEVDNIMEEVDYEIDYFSGSDEAINEAETEQSLKSTEIFGGRYLVGQCPLITIESEPGGFPKTITLDYGEGTELTNGRILKGIITIEISDRPSVDSATRSVSFDEFYVDSINVDGTHLAVWNVVPGVSRICTLTGEIIFTFPDGSTITRTRDKTREWMAGLDTPFYFYDDIIHITGSVNAVASWGDTFSRSIVEPLVKRGDCRHLVAGVVEITINGELKATIDYGDGLCNNVANVTRNGETREVRIRWRRRRLL